ncbi:hypothetical protein ACLOJK_024252 [Asimina triloba]
MPGQYLDNVAVVHQPTLPSSAKHRTASVLGEQSPKSLDPVSSPHQAAFIGQQAWAAGEHPSAPPVRSRSLLHPGEHPSVALILVQHGDGVHLRSKVATIKLNSKPSSASCPVRPTPFEIHQSTSSSE